MTAEELSQAENELRHAAYSEAVVELGSDELDKVAGGAMWHGEDAPDGHEMGCFFAYHTRAYSEETGNWCKYLHY